MREQVTAMEGESWIYLQEYMKGRHDELALIEQDQAATALMVGDPEREVLSVEERLAETEKCSTREQKCRSRPLQHHQEIVKYHLRPERKYTHSKDAIFQALYSPSPSSSSTTHQKPPHPEHNHQQKQIDHQSPPQNTTQNSKNPNTRKNNKRKKREHTLEENNQTKPSAILNRHSDQPSEEEDSAQDGRRSTRARATRGDRRQPHCTITPPRHPTQPSNLANYPIPYSHYIT